MGILDRDYYREDDRGWGDVGFRAVPALIAVTVGVFVVQLFSPPGPDGFDPLYRNGAFYFNGVMDGEVWRLLTSFFVHNPRSLFVIILGMLALYWFGTDMESLYGTRRFLRFYLLAGLTVSAGKMVIGAAGVDQAVLTAGAGGPLFAVLTLYALHFPTRQILLMFVIPVPVGALVAVLIVIYTLFFVGGGGSKMELAVPLGGAAFGAAYYKWANRRSSWGRRDDYRRAEPPPKLTLRMADPDDDPPDTPVRSRAPRPDEYLEAKLDAVLEKMAKSGRDSLTEEENAVLLKASEVYRQKGR
jgi:membrane associated rhomboid family serine protease